MKKTFALLAFLSLSIPCVSGMSACGQKSFLKKFDIRNLSSWGASQKKIFTESYLAYAKKYQSWTWKAWIDSGSMPYFEMFIPAIAKVDKNIDAYSCDLAYQNAPPGQTNLNKAFEKGFDLVINSHRSSKDDKLACGSLKIWIQGSISIPFSKQNVSSWGSVQDEIINKDYLVFAKKWYVQQAPQNRKWSDWLNVGFYNNPENQALTKIFDKINPDISINADALHPGNIFKEFPFPQSNNEDLKLLLTQGVDLYFHGIPYPYNVNGIIGVLGISIKGII